MNFDAGNGNPVTFLKQDEIISILLLKRNVSRGHWILAINSNMIDLHMINAGNSLP